MMPRHVQLMASAGSGKTYQLTSRYLRLVHEGVEPQRILGSTFTRLAAGEIRARIVSRAAEAVLDTARRDALGRALGLDEFDRDAAMSLLDRLIDGLPDLQVMTLDAMLHLIVRAHAIDLGLAPRLELLDDVSVSDLRAEAIRLMLNESEAQRMIDLLRATTKGQSTRGITDHIDRIITELHDLAIDSTDDAWSLPPGPFTTLDDADRREVLAQLERVFDAGLDGRTRKIIERFVEAFPEDDPTGKSISAGLMTIITAGTSYSKPVPPECVEAVQRLVDHSIAIIRALWRSSTAAIFDLLMTYHHRELTLKRRRSAMSFSDLAPLVDHLFTTGSTGTILRRAGLRIDHVLLDEFQDTSIPQWRAIEPVLRDLLRGSTTSIFCVGDVKQSIYTWREGCPDLLERLPELLDTTDHIEHRSLARSYRSSPVIMTAVNRIFGDMVNNPALRENQDVAAWWDGQFVEHDTEHRSMPGYVRFETFSSRTPGDEAVQRPADIIEELHREHPGASIGVLYRRNTHIGPLMFELGPDRRHLPIVGHGGRHVNDAAPANVMLDAMRLIDHPDDTIAAFNVARSPLGEMIGLAPEATPDDRHLVVDRLRRRVLSDGLAATLSGWLHRSASRMSAWDRTRCEQLVELAHEYDGQRSLRIDGFVRYALGTRVPVPSQAPIHIMTIHASKGLEFDIVILPELDIRLENWSNPRYVGYRQEVTGPIERVQPSGSSKLRTLMTDLQPAWTQHSFTRVRESLCMLYVAITRAKQALFGFMKPRSSSMTSFDLTPFSLDGVLMGSLADTLENLDPMSTVYVDGSREALAFDPPTSVEENLSSHGVITIRAPEERFGAARTAPSGDDHAGRSLAAMLTMPDHDALDRGTAIHAFFESLEWLDDSLPDVDVLDRAAQRAVPHRPPAWVQALRADFMTMLDHADVRSALERGERRATVEREWPFARLVDGAVQRGIIDRVDITRNDEGTPIRAHVIDFKTDPVDDDTIDERARGYADQIEAYRTVTAAMLDLDRSDVDATLLFVAAGRCRTLPRVIGAEG